MKPRLNAKAQGGKDAKLTFPGSASILLAGRREVETRRQDASAPRADRFFQLHPCTFAFLRLGVKKLPHRSGVDAPVRFQDL